jgi:hypothetical protein
MSPMKRIIIEETAKVLREIKNKRKISEVEANLYESIKTADLVKSNPKKFKIANKLVQISESRFIKYRNRLKEGHGHEDESEMAKAQLAAIMEKSNELYRMLDGVSHLEDWLQYKLSIAENYIDAVHGYMKYFNGDQEMETEEMYDNQEWDDVDEEDFDDEEFDDFDDEEFDDIEDISDFDDEEFDIDDEEDFDDELI